ncbi:hypothetical protein MSSIH_1530 [Methanosarcina siciliae HI350]|uniref:RelE/StbE replicon stabilization toxin n=1 Tax=Methanosarcina siciliae HI350 TaxID=1434119 RepID=A0A0E3PCM3_9EURY|nr:hypothetical protein [Methanosarcina siciliae]AKB32220.1 hypothetical protein MSSIH_1530 [Methanosarcina siciliae HI350]
MNSENGVYTLDFRVSVEKDLRKVPKDRLPDILKKIEELAETPLPSDSKKLSGAEHLISRSGRGITE